MEDNFSIKEKLYDACKESIEHRILTIQNTLDSVEESRNNETKSSAGDKYETGRAMMQIEEEKARRQLAEVHRVKSDLMKIDLKHNSDNIGTGSLVSTNNGDYFISIGLGKIQIDDKIYFCISVQSPIGLRLLGKKKGGDFEFNGKRFIIEDVR